MWCMDTASATSGASPEAPTVLQYDVVDRLNKSLRHSRVGVGEMAAYLGVERNTVGRYLSGRTKPDTRTLRVWADRTGWPFTYEWLQTGVAPGEGPDDGECARQDSNLRPIAYYATGRLAIVAAPDRALDAAPAWTTAQPAAVAITHRSAKSVTSICRELDTTCEPAHRDAA
jgi:transcriptional regulator with XRE-family HTH domain